MQNNLIKLLFLLTTIATAQVGINTTNPQAALDINSTDSGLLIPRISLTDLSTSLPVINPLGGNLVPGTLVFHDGTNSITAGFYFWSGLGWSSLAGNVVGGDTWKLTGNSGTLPTNFIGTTDASPLSLRTDSLQRVLITADGRVGVNGSLTNSRMAVVESDDNLYAAGISHSGNHPAFFAENTGLTNDRYVSRVLQRGIGGGQSIELTNTAGGPDSAGMAITHNGINGTGQFINMTNPSATRNSSGLFIVYSGSGGGTGSGGSPLEVQNLGLNGSAAEIFTGDPGNAPGPANTTNDYPSLNIVHSATGASPTPGRDKNAIRAVNYSEDPTVFLTNSSTTTAGSVIEAYTTPITATASLTTAIYGNADNSAPNGYGVAVWGDGGNYGVIGGTSANAGSSDFGLLSLTNSGAFGVKSFIIDHPLQPESHTLRHFSIESNEVLNVYRGNITLDANGRGIVMLPDFYEAVNKNPTYQLTAIGTPQQPYVFSEITGNTFVVAGQPSTKVSWVITAERNDPTIQYFSNKKGNDAVQKKPVEHQGKLYVPGAYGRPAEEGVFYRKPVDLESIESHAVELPSGNNDTPSAPEE